MITDVADARERVENFQVKFNQLKDEIAKEVVGYGDVVEKTLIALFAGGHVLLEGVPGIGKTTLVRVLAKALDLDFNRVQFSPDLMPADIVGTNILMMSEDGHKEFRFQKGPIFAHIVLADEINRATPKTQSALLEAMSERRVSVERRRYALPTPFLVLSTQNPVEYLGTFPLPESQLDRFLMSLEMGYPPRDEERTLLMSGGVSRTLDQLEPALAEGQLLALQARTREVKVAEKLVDYILDLAEATRASSEFALPVSTRGVENLYRASQALAFCEGRDFAIPDDVQRLAPPVLGHRVVLKRGDAGLDETRAAISRVLASVPVPL